MKKKNKPLQKKICNFIYEKRKELGLTQKQLADYIGVTQALISKIENGQFVPALIIWFKFCDTFNFDVNPETVSFH